MRSEEGRLAISQDGVLKREEYSQNEISATAWQVRNDKASTER